VYYLEETALDTTTIVTNLKANGNFVASESAIMASSAYFTASGGTNTSYVEAVYQDVLQRPADAPGLSYWAGRLTAGTSTRTSIANYFIRTTEAATRRVAGTSGATSCASVELIDVESIPAGSYCIVLDRLADAPGTTYWTTQLTATDQMPSLWASLAGSTEYYNSAQTRF
ncbi:MAG TPA: DUF4214 domain-containing protein, partial [Iamia sp.]|jgi:hypothetical protein|nr:DUF4214 domain-containing protein [Iamia sp.]